MEAGGEGDRAERSPKARPPTGNVVVLTEAGSPRPRPLTLPRECHPRLCLRKSLGCGTESKGPTSPQDRECPAFALVTSIPDNWGNRLLLPPHSSPAPLPCPLPALPAVFPGSDTHCTMSAKAESKGLDWYSMPCLAHRDCTRGATLW